MTDTKSLANTTVFEADVQKSSASSAISVLFNLEGCDPQTERNSTRSRFINYKHIIAYFSAIDNTLSEKEVSL